MAFYLCDLPSQNSQLKSNHKKNTGQDPIKGQYTKYLLSIPQNHQGHQIQGKSKKMSQPKEAEGTW